MKINIFNESKCHNYQRMYETANNKLISQEHHCYKKYTRKKMLGNVIVPTISKLYANLTLIKAKIVKKPYLNIKKQDKSFRLHQKYFNKSL